MERLDKVLANEKWLSIFPRASVIHLPKTHSDHNPILIEINPKYLNPLPKPCRLESYWCRHPQYGNIINECWDANFFTKASKTFRNCIVDWKDTTSGDLYRKKRIILARLAGIQNSISYGHSNFLSNLEMTLKSDYNNLMKIEEDF